MKDLLTFLNDSPTAFQAMDEIANELKDKGYIALDEKKKWEIEKGGKYYVIRNGSSIIAFNVGERLKNPSLMIAASHSDCPAFKIKPEAGNFTKDYLKVNVETYGGALFHPWFDRPLSIAGRVVIRKENKLFTKNFDYLKPFCMIPSVCIHFDSDANKGKSVNPAIDLQPMVSLQDGDIKGFIAEYVGVSKEDLLGFDLFLYPFEKGIKWGVKEEFISCFHIDDLECAYTSLCGFIDSFKEDNINVYACYDNEEVGSRTLQGAGSDFLENVLKRVADSLKIDYETLLASGMCLSCDNAHAVHPNHPELSDAKNRPVMNGGVVIKQNANQSYTTDGLSQALFKEMLERKNIPYQVFTNRSDLRGGSTLGNISIGHVSILSVDIGLAQLAMHSCYETAGSKDVEYMIDALKAFYSSTILNDGEEYTII